MHSRAQRTWDTTHGVGATRTAMEPVLPHFFGKTQGFHSSIIGRIRKWTVSRQRAKDKQWRWIWCDSLGRCLNLLKFIKFWVSVVVLGVSKHLPNPSCMSWQITQSTFPLCKDSYGISRLVQSARSPWHPCESFKQFSASQDGAHILINSQHGKVCLGILLRGRTRPLYQESS